MSLTDDILMHYGMPRRSGRYPWGSGDNPYQHSGDFLSRVEELKKSNFTFTDKDGKTYTGEVAIAKSMGLSTTQFRTQMSLAKDERRSADVATAKALRAKGYSLNEIADKMGFANDSSVRSLLNESSEARMNQAKQTAEFLKKQISEKGMIDVGTGVERELGISKEKMNQALYILEMEGYPIYGGGVPQVTNPGKQTNIKVLCPPGTEHNGFSSDLNPCFWDRRTYRKSRRHHETHSLLRNEHSQNYKSLYALFLEGREPRCLFAYPGLLPEGHHRQSKG